MDLKGRDFLKLLDFTPEEIIYLLDLAADLKDKKKRGIPVDTFRGKNVALIFEKTSTRTRCSFAVAEKPVIFTNCITVEFKMELIYGRKILRKNNSWINIRKKW